ncbi:MAG: 4-hydroxyphenylpyruvate dioxygenase [Acidobacteriota bacterium]
MLIQKNENRLSGEKCLQLNGIDYVELYVGNVRQAAHFYRTVFGFRPIAYAGLETGERDYISLILEQGDIKLVLTGAFDSDSPIAEHIHLHGDGVKDIAFRVDDTVAIFNETVARGAKPVLAPTVIERNGKRLIKATIATYGDTVHSFIQYLDTDLIFFPNYSAIKSALQVTPIGISLIDHVAISLEIDQLTEWTNFYQQVFGFIEAHHEDIATEYSSMNSRVVEDSTGLIKFVLLEPAENRRKSQIEEYLMFYKGAGVQHIAFATSNIIETTRALRDHDIEFLYIPPAYYDALQDRVGKIEEDISALRDLNILVDRDKWGYLMQVFTKPYNNRPTLFFEVIQRNKARCFGSGNIKALFQALEREQALRGNL